MISQWMKRAGSSIPRGFSRYFVLELLKKTPQTGKEIIDYAIEHSDGIWKPSPGLIYPLLGRLWREGLIEKNNTGRYKITKKGEETVSDLDKIDDIVKKQIEVFFRLGNIGKFVAEELLEKISIMGSILSSDFSNMTNDEIHRYKQFLELELKKIQEKNQKHSENKIEG